MLVARTNEILGQPVKVEYFEGTSSFLNELYNVCLSTEIGQHVTFAFRVLPFHTLHTINYGNSAQ